VRSADRRRRPRPRRADPADPQPVRRRRVHRRCARRHLRRQRKFVGELRRLRPRGRSWCRGTGRRGGLRPAVSSRTLLLEAAGSVFGRVGYGKASTREIAREAGVSESLLFRHFGGKAGVFEQAVLDPARGRFRAYAESWDGPVGGSLEEFVRSRIAGLYALLAEHRQRMLAVLTAFPPGVRRPEHEPGAWLSDWLDDLATAARPVLEPYCPPGVDVTITIRAAFAVVVSAVLLRPCLFGNGPSPDDESLVERTTDFVLHGLAGRAGGHSVGHVAGHLVDEALLARFGAGGEEPLVEDRHRHDHAHCEADREVRIDVDEFPAVDLGSGEPLECLDGLPEGSRR